jgi:2-desacetyl-2-hydroxyethyl bacteriochlorophyllide A dehydrogenase
VYFEGPLRAACRRIEVPLPGPGEVLLRAQLSGISHGTEMNVYRGLAPQWSQVYDQERRLFLRGEGGAWQYPLAYGYVCVGVVERVGAGVSEGLVGTRAFCYRPHQGAHVLAAEQLVPLGDLSAEKGIFFANASTAFNGTLDVTLHYGDVVVVFGLGVIGQIVAQVCTASGCRVVAVDPLAQRRELARRWGAEQVFDPRDVGDVALAVREISDGRGADVVFDITGNPQALNEAIRTAAPDCSVVALSWYAKPASDLVLSGEFHHNRIHIRSSQVGRVNPLLVNWSVARRQQTVLGLLRRFAVEDMIMARFTPAQAAEAYGAVDRKEEPPLQAVFAYP